MIKRILIFGIVVVIGLIVCSFLHENYLVSNDLKTRISITSVYLFFAIASLFIYTVSEVLHKFLPSQTGYFFLAAITIKFGVFILIFQKELFLETSLTKVDRFAVFIPFFFFFFLLILGVARLLNRTVFSKE